MSTWRMCNEDEKDWLMEAFMAWKPTGWDDKLSPHYFENTNFGHCVDAAQDSRYFSFKLEDYD